MKADLFTGIKKNIKKNSNLIKKKTQTFYTYFKRHIIRKAPK